MKSAPGLCFAVIVVLVLSSCSRKDQNSGVASAYSDVSHPTPENIPDQSSDYYHKLAVNTDNEPDVSSPNFEVGKLSAETENDPELFGEIVGAANYEDKVIALDRKLNEIRFYNQNGYLTYRTNRQGKGPGEFQNALKMAISDDTLFVLDSNLKLNSYQIAGDSIEYLDSKVFDFGPEDMCLMNGSVVIRGNRVGRDSDQKQAHVLHFYSTESFEPQQSIGETYKSDNWLTVNQLSDGPVACDPEGERLFYANRYLPYIYVLTSGGKISGILDIGDAYNQLLLEETVNDRGTPSFRTPVDGTQKGEAIKNIQLSDDRKHLIVQSRYIDRTDGVPKFSVKTYFINIDAYTIDLISYDYPWIYEYSEEEWVGGYEYPFPKLVSRLK